MKVSRWFALAVCLGVAAAGAAEEPATLERRMREQLRQQPADLDARFQLARALSWQGRHDAALAEYARLRKIRPDNVDYLFGAAQTQLWRGAPEAALPLLKEARRRAPHYEDVWRVQIQALLALGDDGRFAQARTIRKEARQRFPKSDWRFAALDDVAPAPTATDVTAPSAAPTPAPIPIPAPAARQPTTAATPAPPEPPSPLPRAPVTEPSRFLVAADIVHEKLSRGLPAWREERILGEWRLPGQSRVYGGLRATERYRLADTEMHLGGVLPVATDVQVQIEAGASDSHRVLPAHYLALHLHYRPAPGWALTAGLRRSEYDSGATRVASLGADRYFGAERLGYSLYLGGPDGSGRSPSHRLHWAHSYGENDWIGFAWVRGRETEHVTAGFLTSRIRAAALNGQHGLTSDWTLVWEIGAQHQGDLYTRRGARLGLRHTF